MACTHYPFLVNRFRQISPWPVDWLDPAEAVARRALSLLGPANGEVIGAQEDIAIFTSGNVNFAKQRLMSGFGLTLAQL